MDVRESWISEGESHRIRSIPLRTLRSSVQISVGAILERVIQQLPDESILNSVASVRNFLLLIDRFLGGPLLHWW